MSAATDAAPRDHPIRGRARFGQYRFFARGDAIAGIWILDDLGTPILRARGRHPVAGRPTRDRPRPPLRGYARTAV